VFFDPSKLPLAGVSVGITVAIAILLFYSGGFGGADSKAFMCIALALPFSPANVLTPVFEGGVSPLAQFIFPFTIFSNSILVAAVSVIAMLLVNAKWRVISGKKIFEGTLANESLGKKILVLMTGYKMPLKRLQDKWHIYPMEDVTEENADQTLVTRKLVIMPRDEGREEIVERLSQAAAAGKIDSNVLASPGLPMLIFVTIGLIISLFFGDVVWLLIRFIAS
jgi:preflagellin peptidase FlaK